jgi:23S rRNA (uracil1939-C5)-methyltransferase
MVVIVTAEENFPGRSNFVKAVTAQCKEVTTIVQNINTRSTSAVLGNKENILYGKGYIIDELCGKKFKISSKSFYQINPYQTEVLYNSAIDNAGLKMSDTILDAYSGVGTIGLIASSRVRKVLSVEIEKSAIIDAQFNAKINNIKNVSFFNDDASNFIVNLANRKEHMDAIIMDPPRSGSDERFLKAVLKLMPEKIIYISCNPNTQVTDLKLLVDKYEMTYIQPVDMFPHTAHVENIVILKRK